MSGGSPIPFAIAKLESNSGTDPMFALEEELRPDGAPPRKYLIDPERSARFDWIGGADRRAGEACVLYLRDLIVPFDTYTKIIGPDDDYYVLGGFDTFGNSLQASRHGINPTPLNDPDRDEAQLIAAEAVLVFHYKFFTNRPEGGYRFNLNDHEYQLHDFEYTTPLPQDTASVLVPSSCPHQKGR